MDMQAQTSELENPFADARAQFEKVVVRLQSREARGMTHADVERLISSDGNEVLRLLFQGHLDVRGPGAAAKKVVGADGVVRPYERLMGRRLKTVFGLVDVDRMMYSAKEVTSLAPRDAELNLPPELYSHGLRRRVANEVARGSFDDAGKALAETTGTTVPKRQIEELAQRSTVDFEPFYATRSADSVREASKTGPLLVVSADGKGVVMRREGLRDATRKAAEERTHKMRSRLSKGEKRNAKRMATVAAVYSIARMIRTPEDVLKDLSPVHDATPARPRPEHKRVWASLERSPAEVIDQAFAEAKRRDPSENKTWLGMVDGSLSQLKTLRETAAAHGIDPTIIVDFIHVSEYVWKAARAFHAEGSPAAEAWVTERLAALLRGKSSEAAAGMRRSATLRGMSAKKRKPVDKCAAYLIKYRPYLRYDEYLAAGYPISTGVIEGTCRHLINDRLDITGAHWGLAGAEAILRLRSLRASGDFDDYWVHHESAEWLRNHSAAYSGGNPPKTVQLNPRRGSHLHVVN
jgi:hypothetical protein